MNEKKPIFNPDYKNPYQILTRIYVFLKLPMPVEVSEENVQKCLKYAKILYFPKACPRCHHAYPKAKKKSGLYLTTNPDQMHCYECYLKILGKAFTEGFIEQRMKQLKEKEKKKNE